MKTDVVFLRDVYGCPYCDRYCSDEAGCDDYRDDVDGLLKAAGVFAIFPGHAACVGRTDLMVCYSNVGQHASASFDYCLGCAEVTNPDEYADLLTELGRVGYDVHVVGKDRINDSEYSDSRKQEVGL